MNSVTPESVARAKADTDAERERVYQRTGIRITDDGVILPPPNKPHLIGCPRAGCTFMGSARTDGGAVRSLSAHLVASHLRAVK